MGQVPRAPGCPHRRSGGGGRARVAPRAGPPISPPGPPKNAPKSASLLAACSLSRAQPGGCAWCGTALPPRRRTWCSDRCGDAFWNNHWWSQARAAAKKRDKYRCRQCGHAPPKRPSRVRFPSETGYRAAMRAWRAGKAENRVEVNHRSPALGAHGSLSCIHHLDNLETLCVACHKQFTSATRPRRAPEHAGETAPA